MTFLVLSYAPPELAPYLRRLWDNFHRSRVELPAAVFGFRITSPDALSNSPSRARRNVSPLMKNSSRPLRAILLVRTIASVAAAEDHAPHVVGEHSL